MVKKTNQSNELLFNMLKGYALLFISILIMYGLEIMSFWMAGMTIATITMVLIIIAILINDDGKSIMEKMLYISGFLIGFALIIIPFPMTDPIGWAIIGGCAYKIGWISEDNKLVKLIK
jgi:hypothetical protein